MNKKINWTDIIDIAIMDIIIAIICNSIIVYINISCIKDRIDWYYFILIDIISFIILSLFYYVVVKDIKDIIWKIKHK